MTSDDSDTQSNQSQQYIPQSKKQQKSIGQKSQKKQSKVNIKQSKSKQKNRKQKDKKQIKKKKQQQQKPKSKSNQQQDYNALIEIKNYMLKQNRPYNLLMIYDNLHAKYKKNIMQSVLTELVQTNQLTCKEFGKNKIYFWNQNKFQINPSEIDQLTSSITNLRCQQVSLNQQYKKINDQYKKLMNRKTINEIKEDIVKTKLQVNRLTLKKQSLSQNTTKKVEISIVQKIEQEEIKLRKQLKKRKKLTKQLLNLWSQILQKKIPEVMDLMGVQIMSI